MTITAYTDREIALQAQLAAMTASRDECKQSADKMAWDHKVERDTLRQHIKHIGNDAMRSENRELRQKLAEAQRDAERMKVALSNAEDSLLNWQAWALDRTLAGFGKTCKNTNDLALELVQAAMKGAA
jgi:hypothetical protein